MKNFFKKIAFVLALALVFSNIAPAASASAAAAPSLKYTSKVIYVGDDALGMYGESCWTPSQNTSGYTVAYSTKSTIIDVAKNGKITANGTGIGKAVVAVTYSKAGVKDITANFTVKVRRNAETVRLTNASAELLANAMNVGDKLTLDAAKSIDGSYAKGHYGLNNYMGVCSDQLILVSSNEEVVKVNGMSIEAVGVGEATITVKAVQYAQNEETGVASEKYNVVVAGGMLSVKQTKANEFVVMMGKDIEKITAADFDIKDSNSRVVQIKEAKIASDDAKKITVITYNNVTDGKDYTIEHDGAALSFTASKGIVRKIVNDTPAIVANKATLIKFSLLDENDVILQTITSDQNVEKVDYSITTENGYISTDGLTLFEVGNTATLSVTYHTYDFDASGNEIGAVKEDNLQIVAVEKAPVTVGDLKAKIATSEPTWDDVTSKSTIVCVGDTTYNIYAYVKDSDDVDVTRDKNYTLESSNNNLLVVGATVSSNKGIAYNVYALDKMGSAYILVKNDAGAVVDSIPVEIKGKRQLTRIELDTPEATLSNATDDIAEAVAGNVLGAVNDTKQITITFKDQYSEDMSIGEYTVNALSVPTGVTKANVTSGNAFYSVVGNKITFDGEKFTTQGTYQFEIKSGNVSRIFKLNIKMPGAGDVEYRLVLPTSAIEIGCKDNANNDTAVSVAVKVGMYKGGVLAAYLVTPASVHSVIVKKGNDEIKNVNIASPSAYGKAADEQAAADDGIYGITLRVMTGSSMEIKKVDVGTYNVVVVVSNGGNGKSINGTFTVKDSEKALTVDSTLKKITVSKNDITDYAGLAKAVFTFKYNGTEVNDSDKFEVVSVKVPNRSADAMNGGDSIGDTGSIAITEITISYLMGNSGNAKVYKTFTINRTVTVTE